MTLVLLIINFGLIFNTWYISKRIYSKSFNALNIFTIWWLFSLTLAQINYAGFYPLSDTLQLLFYMPVVGYIVGTIIASSIWKKRKVALENKSKIKITKSIFFISVIVLLFTVGYAIFIYLLSKKYGFDLSEIRKITFRGDSYGISPIFSKLVAIAWTVYGIIFFLLFLGLYQYLINKDIKGRYIILINTISLVSMGVAMAGRTSILYIIYIIIILFFIYYPHRRQFFSLKEIAFFRKRLKYIIFLALILIIVITGYRDSNGNSVWGTVWFEFNKYYVGPFVAFDQMIQTKIIVELQNDITRFGMSFLGLDTVVVSGFMRFIFGSNVHSLLSETSSIMNSGVLIKRGVIMNAHYTSVLSLFLDGGALYIFIFFFIFGIFSHYFQIKFYQNPSYLNFIGLVMIYLFVINSTSLNLFAEPKIFIFILMSIIYNWSQKKNKKKNDLSSYHKP